MVKTCQTCADVQAELTSLKLFLSDWFTNIMTRFDAHEIKMARILASLDSATRQSRLPDSRRRLAALSTNCQQPDQHNWFAANPHQVPDSSASFNSQSLSLENVMRAYSASFLPSNLANNRSYNSSEFGKCPPPLTEFSHPKCQKIPGVSSTTVQSKNCQGVNPLLALNALDSPYMQQSMVHKIRPKTSKGRINLTDDLSSSFGPPIDISKLRHLMTTSSNNGTTGGQRKRRQRKRRQPKKPMPAKNEIFEETGIQRPIALGEQLARDNDELDAPSTAEPDSGVANADYAESGQQLGIPSPMEESGSQLDTSLDDIVMNPDLPLNNSGGPSAWCRLVEDDGITSRPQQSDETEPEAAESRKEESMTVEPSLVNLGQSGESDGGIDVFGLTIGQIDDGRKICLDEEHGAAAAYSCQNEIPAPFPRDSTVPGDGNIPPRRSGKPLIPRHPRKQLLSYKISTVANNRIAGFVPYESAPITSPKVSPDCGSGSDKSSSTQETTVNDVFPGIGHTQDSPTEQKISVQPIQNCDKHLGEPGHYLTDDFQCTLCGKQLSSRANGVKHVRLHIDGRTILCPHCPMRFATRYNLNMHLMRKHDQAGLGGLGQNQGAPLMAEDGGSGRVVAGGSVSPSSLGN